VVAFASCLGTGSETLEDMYRSALIALKQLLNDDASLSPFDVYSSGVVGSLLRAMTVEVRVAVKVTR